MEGRGLGRGTGRGTGRGVPAQAIPSSGGTTTVSPAETPAPAVVVPTSAGRGRGKLQTQQSVSSTTSAASAPPAQEAPAASLMAGTGRGVAGRGRGISRTVSVDPFAAAHIANPTTAVVGPSAPKADLPVEKQLEKLSMEPEKPVSTKVTEGPQGTGVTPKPAKPGKVYPDQLEGKAGADAEKERREAELKFMQKPKGTVGKKLTLLGNVVHFDADAEAMVFEYRVDFYPQTWAPRMRTKLIEKIEDQIHRPYLFDFDNLFLARELPNEEQDFIVTSPFGDTQYKLTVRRVMSNRANESKELLNLIVKELEITMKYTQIGRNRYNPKKRVALKEGNMPALEIWPGFQTSVNPFTGGILLMTDPAFRVVRVGDVKTLIETWRKQSGPRDEQFQKNIRDNLLGSTVLTPYNDKSYVVSDVAWDKSPLDTFDTPKGPITYVQYYKEQHNLTIKDPKQPLMFSRPTPTGAKRRDNRLIALIPELCVLTGIQDDLRANFTAMKAITTTTKLSPQARHSFIMEYLNQFVQSTEAQELLQNWGIKISVDLLRLPGRLLQPETIQFGTSARPYTTVPDNGDWTRNVTNATMLGSMPMKNWTLVFQARDQRMAIDFDKMLREVGRGLGMDVGEPHILPINSDTNITYTNSVSTAVKDHKSEMVVLIFPTPRDDRYAAVKKSCYIVHGVASQCINQKTLSRPDRMRAIVQKIAMQINCKLGGYLWRMGKFSISTNKGEEALRLMVVGIDAYHDLKRQRESVTALVASTNEDFTQWHSRCNFQSPKSELGAGLKVSFMSAMNAYVKANKMLPNTIVIFRDGLSDSELDQAVNFELPQIAEVCRDPAVVLELLHSDSSGSESSSSQESDYAPEIYFIVVQKRINQRLFLIESERGGQMNLGNPKPGTVCDDIITRRDMYDFYLVPQNVREGSVTPVHFIVVHQPKNPRLSVDHIQSLAYKLTHMYYNWTGTVRVPAPCQYAHKLAYQSGACYDHTEPRADMADKLFFL